MPSANSTLYSLQRTPYECMQDPQLPACLWVDFPEEIKLLLSEPQNPKLDEVEEARWTILCQQFFPFYLTAFQKNGPAPLEKSYDYLTAESYQGRVTRKVFENAWTFEYQRLTPVEALIMTAFKAGNFSVLSNWPEAVTTQPKLEDTFATLTTRTDFYDLYGLKSWMWGELNHGTQQVQQALSVLKRQLIATRNAASNPTIAAVSTHVLTFIAQHCQQQNTTTERAQDYDKLLTLQKQLQQAPLIPFFHKAQGEQFASLQARALHQYQAFYLQHGLTACLARVKKRIEELNTPVESTYTFGADLARLHPLHTLAFFNHRISTQFQTNPRGFVSTQANALYHLLSSRHLDSIATLLRLCPVDFSQATFRYTLIHAAKTLRERADFNWFYSLLLESKGNPNQGANGQDLSDNPNPNSNQHLEIYEQPTLMLAVAFNNVAAVQRLLKDPQVRVNFADTGHNLMALAIAHDNPEMVACLLAHNQQQTHTESKRPILQNDDNPETEASALHRAFARCAPAVIHRLLENKTSEERRSYQNQFNRILAQLMLDPDKQQAKHLIAAQRLLTLDLPLQIDFSQYSEAQLISTYAKLLAHCPSLFCRVLRSYSHTSPQHAFNALFSTLSEPQHAHFLEQQELPLLTILATTLFADYPQSMAQLRNFIIERPSVDPSLLIAVINADPDMASQQTTKNSLPQILLQSCHTVFAFHQALLWISQQKKPITDPLNTAEDPVSEEQQLFCSSYAFLAAYPEWQDKAVKFKKQIPQQAWQTVRDRITLTPAQADTELTVSALQHLALRNHLSLLKQQRFDFTSANSVTAQTRYCLKLIEQGCAYDPALIARCIRNNRYDLLDFLLKTNGGPSLILSKQDITNTVLTALIENEQENYLRRLMIALPAKQQHLANTLLAIQAAGSHSFNKVQKPLAKLFFHAVLQDKQKLEQLAHLAWPAQPVQLHSSEHNAHRFLYSTNLKKELLVWALKEYPTSVYQTHLQTFFYQAFLNHSGDYLGFLKTNKNQPALKQLCTDLINSNDPDIYRWMGNKATGFAGYYGTRFWQQCEPHAHPISRFNRHKVRKFFSRDFFYIIISLLLLAFSLFILSIGLACIGCAIAQSHPFETFWFSPLLERFFIPASELVNYNRHDIVVNCIWGAGLIAVGEIYWILALVNAGILYRNATRSIITAVREVEEEYLVEKTKLSAQPACQQSLDSSVETHHYHSLFTQSPVLDSPSTETLRLSTPNDAMLNSQP